MMSTGVQHIQQQVGRYEIGEEIGRGGMGVVYHAYEPALDRPIALKVLSPDLAHDPGFVERLHREAVSAARLRHPHIALLYEFGQSDGAAFLAMEYVRGPSLRQLLNAGMLPIEQALRILEQIAEALAYAHSMGIVHRDVKPSNIVVGPGDQAVLIDFGLAQMAEDSLVTGDGTMLGTPHYMAPEQARGEGADARSDQYALAAVAYEMLTGTPPFHGRAAAAVVHGHIYERPAVPSERHPALPEAVNRVLLRALAKSPHARYDSPTELVADLRAAFAPTVASQRGIFRRRLAGSFAALAILVIAGASILLWVNRQPVSTAPPAPPARAIMPLPQRIAWVYDPGLAGGSAPVIAADTVVFGTLDGSVVALEAGDGSVRWKKDGGSSLYGAPGAGAGQLFVGTSAGEVLNLSPANGSILWRQNVLGPVQQAPLRSNDRLLVTTGRGYVYAIQTGNGKVLWSRQVAQGIRALAVGAGSVIVAASDTLYALDWSTGATRWEFRTESTISTPPVVDGDLVLAGTERGILHGVGVADGKPRFRYQARGPLSAAPVAEDNTIYLADQSGTVAALKREAAQSIWQFELDHTAITATPLLADGKLLFGTSGGNIYSLDARSGRQLAMIGLDSSMTTDPVLGAGYIYVCARRVYAVGS